VDPTAVSIVEKARKRLESYVRAREGESASR
jgi:hypothetical protein